MVENEVMNYAKARKRDAGEILRDMRDHLASQAVLWTTGGLLNLSSPPVLLAVLCQLAEQRWSFTGEMLRPSPGLQGRIVRGVWLHGSTRCPSCERELAGQSAREHSNTVQELSSFMAHAALRAWENAYNQNAKECHPLTNGIPRKLGPELTGLRGLVKSARRNRVGRLKGYGNSVSPPVTAAFITACMEPF